jgi:hypothetical protein
VDDLGKKDQKMLNTLALIELETIFDEYNIKFSRRKAKQKVKGELCCRYETQPCCMFTWYTMQ